jgi:SAM-dependent methyltransferase
MKRAPFASLALAALLISPACEADFPKAPPKTASAPSPVAPPPTISMNAIDPNWIKRDVPYVPTAHETVVEMLRMANVSSDDVVYDLGSGDGRIVISAARDFGARGVGIEIDPERIETAVANARKARVADRVRFIEQDLFEADIREATVVTIYLLPTVNFRLRPKLLAELRPGTPVVSHAFSMADWDPDDQKDLGDDIIFLWIVPAKVEGTWMWLGSDRERIYGDILQHFQRFRGTAQTRRGSAVLAETLLEGDRISFTMTRHGDDGRQITERYSGRVSGKTIEGRVVADGGRPRAWVARRD